jgi:hypothetical protein
MSSVCGVDCTKCPDFKKECAGCDAQEGKVFWTKYIEKDCCPIFSCVKEKGYSSCGACAQVPCELWFSLKDPARSEEEHQRKIQERLAELKRT